MTFADDLAEAMNPTGRSKEHRPCALGKEHRVLGPSPSNPGVIVVWCEHGLSDWACAPCRGDPLTREAEKCTVCGTLKRDHTDREAALCIRREIAMALDKPAYVSGP